MIVTITKIYRSDKDKNGNPLKTHDGRPYSKISIKTQEHGEKWLSGFENFRNQKWREGERVDIEVEKNGDYLNFSQPSAVQLLERRVKILEDAILKNKKVEEDDIPVISEEDIKDLPF